MAKPTIRTPEKDEQFFRAVIATGGNVTKACEVAGYGRASVYEYKAADPEFAARMEQAAEKGVEALEDEARRRAHRGVNKPVYYQGKRVGIIREYSDLLLIFLLKAHKPDRYRERLGIDFGNATPEQIEAGLRKLPVSSLRAILSKLEGRDDESGSGGT